MSDRLATYLQDHLAGATFGINLLASLRDQYEGNSFSTTIAAVLQEVEEDRKTLQQLAEGIGGGEDALKDATAWLAEKATRLKFRFGSDPDLGAFEALELMSLGILGKRALWQALQQLAAHEPRLQSLDFPSLISRAESQYQRIGALRRAHASRALMARGV